MNHFKTYLFKNFETFSLVILSSMTAIILLMIRMKITKSFHLIFLVWNLFLAFIPFAISSFITTNKLNKWMLVPSTIIWLLFLPNAPYIITDLLHVRASQNYIASLDILVITTFAGTGLYLFYSSLISMREMLISVTPNWLKPIGLISLLTLSSFGVYLGRFLRFNSWDLIKEPQSLFIESVNIIVQPLANKSAWLFIFSFSMFLLLGYRFFEHYLVKSKTIALKNIE
ncbi:DUF1361 domain-containing protein [Aegicerativicinus sediminis]|uniref:DUF1361 domain-containing protein n=1 Tax=Aegicerativicinus sediminis TaxID=2893202 RepID=UPI001E65BF04|nr:DUF1361 domain-containing protein [Aegicerativicinus sediminis]